MKEVNIKVVIGVLACIFAVFVIWFIVNSNSVESKYGMEAVEDAKSAIFTADQYLDGKREKREYQNQLKRYSKDNVEIGDKTYDIYHAIEFMTLMSSDADILKYRNELADLVGEKKR
jgi:hypothetical protein